jgi:subtilisin family serine protease
MNRFAAPLALLCCALGPGAARAVALEVIVLLREPPGAGAVAPPAGAGESDGARVARVAALQRQFISAAAALDFEASRRLSHLPIVIGEIPERRLRDLAALPGVASVEEPRTYRVQRAEGGLLIRSPQLRSQFGAAGAGIGVAVLDTGIDLAHPEFAGRIAVEADFTGTTADGDDDHGHGTAVAGIIAGSPGGMAPAARLWALKVTRADGTGTSIALLEGLNFAFANRQKFGGLRVVNLSIGGGGPVSTSCGAGAIGAAIGELAAARIAVVAASGNDGFADGVTDLACHPQAIAVGAVYDANLGQRGPFAAADGCVDATTAADQIPCYSNSGEPLDVLAPAQCAVTAAPGGAQNTCFGGTSAAAAYASGAAAQILSARPDTTPGQLRQALIKTGRPRVGALGRVRSRIDALAAFQALGPGGGPCVGDSGTACLVAGRFKVEMSWRAAATSTAAARVVQAGLEHSAILFFHNPDNWEVLLKVLDGCVLNGHYWVFFAGATNVEFEITVTDTHSGQSKTYANPLGRAAPPVQDVAAFATCP